MAAALSRVELQPHRSCAARLALHCRSSTGRPSRHARRHRATKAPARRAASVRLLASTAAANGDENRATLAGAASKLPSKGRRGTPTRPSKGGRKTRKRRKEEEKKKRRRIKWFITLYNICFQNMDPTLCIPLNCIRVNLPIEVCPDSKAEPDRKKWKLNEF